jgi:hypothetical protein
LPAIESTHSTVSGFSAGSIFQHRLVLTGLGRNPEKRDADDIAPEILGLLGAPLRYRVSKFGIYYAKDLVKLCRDAKIPLKKGVPSSVWAQKKPIRIRFPATKPSATIAQRAAAGVVTRWHHEIHLAGPQSRDDRTLRAKPNLYRGRAF